MSSQQINAHQKKVFEQDVLADQADNEQLSDDSYEDIDDQNQQPINGFKRQKFQDEDQDGIDQAAEYATLKTLIQKLNDEDHSEDEGIEDYKIGGYHPCHIGEVLINRYVLIQKLGWGHFSTVWLAKDFKYGNYAAVKIMKSSPHYLQASYDQVQILQKVASNAYHPDWIKSLKQYEPDKENISRDDTHVLNLLNSFLHKGPYGNHFCMVFQILGVNLLQVLKRYDYKGLPLDLVKEITRQVMMGLDFLNRICRVIHTDLKPQNVLLCLTDEEIKQIVQNGQLTSKELFNDRLKLYRHKYGLGPTDDDHDDQQPQSNLQPSVPESKQQPSELQSQISTKIQELKQILQDNKLNKNQKKNYRKKLKKYEEKLEEETSLRKKKQVPIEKKLPQQTAHEKKKKKIKDLFSAFDTKLVMSKGPKLQKGFKVKIADLGNACWEHHHFATEIQTRQYRGPEVLLGSKYNLTADMWSLACMSFEMLTGQLLFNPHKDNNDSFGKNDDHLAQMMELLGRFPRKFTSRGTKARKYFSQEGNMIRIPKLQNWSLKDVMIAKYRFTEEQALLLEQFMTPLLNCYPERRVLAHEMLSHPWLTSATSENYFMSLEQHAKIKAERYDLEIQKEEFYQYESENEDGEVEDNCEDNDTQEDDQFYGYEKVGTIRLIDRSFMDLGYIGYGEGIFLEQLDAGPNWQFQAN